MAAYGIANLGRATDIATSNGSGGSGMELESINEETNRTSGA